VGAGAGTVVQTSIEQLLYTSSRRYQGVLLGTTASRASSSSSSSKQQQLSRRNNYCRVLHAFVACYLCSKPPTPTWRQDLLPLISHQFHGTPHSPRRYWHWVLVCSRRGRAHNVVQGARLPSCFESSPLTVLLRTRPQLVGWLPFLWCEHRQLHPRCSLCISRRFPSSALQTVDRPRLSSHHSIWPIMALVYPERIVWKSTAWAPLNGSQKEESWNAVLFDARDGGAKWASRFILGSSCESTTVLVLATSNSACIDYQGHRIWYLGPGSFNTTSEQ
jgi:hypothetical protein